jgi:hypothetical protein
MTDEKDLAQFEKVVRGARNFQEEADEILGKAARDRKLEEAERQQLELWQSFYTQPGDEFEFRIARTPDAIERDGTTKTFSEAAMDALMQHVMVYIGTRLTRYFETNKVMPQSLTVRIKVVTDSALADWSEFEPDIVINARDQDPDGWDDLANPTPKEG